MSASSFVRLDHVPHVLVAEVAGQNGSALLSLGDDVDVARLTLLTRESSLALNADELRDFGVAAIELAGRLEQKAWNGHFWAGNNLSY